MYNLILYTIAIILVVSVVAITLYFIRCMILNILRHTLSTCKDAYDKGYQSEITKNLIVSAILYDTLYGERNINKPVHLWKADTIEDGYFPTRYR